MPFSQMMLATQSIVFDLIGGTFSDSQADPTTPFVQVQLRTTGVIDVSDFDATVASSNWVDPTSLAPGAYESRVTEIIGTINIGTPDVWEALTSQRTYGVAQSTIGTKNCNFTLEVRLGSIVVASTTFDFTAQQTA